MTLRTAELDCTEEAESSASANLPSRLRFLCVTTHEPSWVSLTLQLDAHGCFEPSFVWASSVNQAVSSMRHEVFDCVIVSVADGESPEFALQMLHAARSAEHDEPVVVMASSLSDHDWEQFAAYECEVFTSKRQWESSALLATVRRATSRRELTSEIRRLENADQRRLARERDEAEQLLQQQQMMIKSLKDLLPDASEGSRSSIAPQPVCPELPPEINNYYHDLLRTYVIMGSGSLESEIEGLAGVFSMANIGPREAVEIHLKGLESLVRGLGNRSARHVMSRADLLVLDLLINLGEKYRQR